jgi:hypothetical protein
MKEFVRDFVENYDVDGIEYDFFRHGQIFKTVGWGAYATEAQLELMTEFMLELRKITEAAGRKKGRPILVLVRTSDSLAYAKAQGIDVETWLRRRVMDIWSVSDYFQLDYLRPNAELAHKYGVKFNSALAESRVPGTFGRLKKSNKRFAKAIMLPGRNSIASYAAEYAAARPENVARIYFDNALLTFDGYRPPAGVGLGPWERSAPKGGWRDDPRMPVNLASRIAKTGIPALFVYGTSDTAVKPDLNSRAFVANFMKAGGNARVCAHAEYGHHPHGVEPDEAKMVVDFFEK